MACTVDFRCLDEGFGGKTYKRKRESQSLITTGAEDTTVENSSMEVDDNDSNPPPKRAAVPSLSDPNKPVFGRPTYDGVIAGKVSGRNWKQPRHRASARAVSRNPLSFEQRMREREVKKAYKERKEELKEEIRRNKIEKRKQREEKEKKKQENILKSGTKLQKITNPKTLKKIAKSKQRKQLKVVSDDLLKK
uniref:Coiled-coil domain-containing protein 86 n=2 Tax=Opuntia streptacantha TaxID=393608 RepID=A0A7C9D863_OPUST